MPLKRGSSRKTIGSNISEMEASGHSRAQSIAASLNEARKSGANIPKKGEGRMKRQSVKDRLHEGEGMARRKEKKKLGHRMKKAEKHLLEEMKEHHAKKKHKSAMYA